jgi:hypothetical protein
LKEVKSLSDEPATQNPLALARKLGFSVAGSIGERAMEELELCYASRLLPMFTDDQVTRIRINLLLYWKAGFYKSTLLKEFSKTIPLATVNITSMTLQKIFGSIDPKQRSIVLPAFTNNVYFVLISELTALLGQKDMKEFANVMNQVLEGEQVNRQTLTLSYQIDGIAEIERCKKFGVRYDPERGELSYRPDVCVVAASRPLDNRYFNYLFRSGYFSRFHVIQLPISDKEAHQHIRKNYILDTSLQQCLKELNARLAKCKIGVMKRPSESLTNDLFDELQKMAVDEVSGRRYLTLSDILTPRVKDDIIRELVAHAFLRMAAQNGFNDIVELVYTPEDIAYVKENLYHFIEFSLDPLIAPDFITTRSCSKRDAVKTILLKTLEDGLDHETDQVENEIKNQCKVCTQTVYNAINELKKEAAIESPRHGFIKIRDGGSGHA